MVSNFLPSVALWKSMPEQGNPSNLGDGFVQFRVLVKFFIVDVKLFTVVVTDSWTDHSPQALQPPSTLKRKQPIKFINKYVEKKLTISRFLCHQFVGKRLVKFIQIYNYAESDHKQ